MLTSEQLLFIDKVRQHSPLMAEAYLDELLRRAEQQRLIEESEKLLCESEAEEARFRHSVQDFYAVGTAFFLEEGQIMPPNFADSAR